MARLYCLTRTQHRVLKVTKGTRKSIVGWTVDPVGSEVEHGKQMNELELLFQENGIQELLTRNEDFDKNGYLVVKDLWDPKELYHPVPEEKGQYNYYDKNPEHFNYVPVEQQVEGSTNVLAPTISHDSLWYSYETGGNHYVSCIIPIIMIDIIFLDKN